MFGLHGRLALVAGAGQGIGAGITHYLTRQGGHFLALEASSWMTSQTLLIEGGP